jgi:cytochrome c556
VGRSKAMAAALAAGLALGAWAGPAQGAEDAAYVEYRQKVMQGIGADMGAIGDILKHGLPFTASIAIHAAKIERAAALIGPAFEKRVVEGETDAKPEIWQEPEDWQEHIDALETAAANLEETAGGDDPEAVRAAVKKLGGACGDCHDDFRVPKEESYKNR